MEDDDEFGDLYTDVLLSFQPPSSAATTAASPPQPSTAPPFHHRPIDLNSKNGDGSDTPNGASRAAEFDVPSRPTNHPLVVDPQNRAGDYRQNSEGGDVRPRLGAEKEVNSDVGSRVLEGRDGEFQCLSYGGESGKGAGNGKGGDLMDKDMEFDIEEGHGGIGDIGSDPFIPGLSTGGDVFVGASGRTEDAGGGGGGGGDDWDSDSEDDLQIVLNDNNHGPMAMERGGMVGEDDEDGDPLVIVADSDANQATGEQEWGEDGLQAADGERKEMGEAGKANGGIVMAPKVGYSSHGYHPFHSQFKYVRPGAATVPGSNTAIPGGAPGQVRPLVNIGPVAGRGRGEWRPSGQVRPPMQKGFGFGAPTWGAGRGVPSGPEFTLPSHRTIFDVDIDSFEEKPWKYPGIDISDFFNFGLNEESWKGYCKQLEQLRLESTMQSKIRVYESGRTEHDYDPDMPPELAAAAGVHDVAAENGKFDVGQSDFAKGSARMRPPLPTGRAIQVETGYSERLPSIDTRPPRMRDSDAIIEIVCQDSTDDDSLSGNDQPENNPSREDLRGHEAEKAENDHYSSQKREVLPFPPEAPARGSRSHSPDGHEERRVRGRDTRLFDKDKEESVESMDSKQSPVLSSSIAVIDHKDATLDDDLAPVDGNSDVEKEILDTKNTFKDGNSLKKRKVNSPPLQETNDGEAARSSENGDDKGVEEEVLQDGRGIHKKHYLDENEKSFGRKDVERNRVAPKGREDPYSRRDWDPNHLHVKSEAFDRRKERDNPDVAWQRRDDDPQNRRIRVEDTRKRERGEEMASRHRANIQESEKDEHLHSRKQLDNGTYRAPYDSSRLKERDNNLKNADSKRRKDRDESLHGHSSRQKRERDDVVDPRKRDDQLRSRDNTDDHHSDRQKERENRHRQKQSREESLPKRSGRGAEEKAWVGHAREKDEHKEHQSKDTARHSEQLKRRDRVEDESVSHRRGREDVHARGNHSVNEERRSRQERSSSRNDSSQRVHERKNKENTRANKDSQGGDQNSTKKHQDLSTHVDETGKKGSSEQNGEKNIQVRQSSRKHKEAASSDEEQQDSRRGRSKLERWTSHKERDFIINSKSSSSLKLKQIDANNHARSSEAANHPDSSTKAIATVSAEEARHTSAEETNEQDLKDGGDKKPLDERHLDTVEKLKKRSERFKLPMPVEKETSTTNTEAPSAADSEIKPERPARKRRWISQ